MSVTLINFNDTLPGTKRNVYLDTIALWRNDPTVQPALRNSPYLTSPDMQSDWFQSVIRDKSSQYYFIFEGSVLIGYCGLDKIHSLNRTGEISMLINPERHGEGFGKEAVESLLAVGFVEFNLKCIYAEVYQTTTNWKFWSKCGFKKEGVLKRRKYWNGKYYDSVIGSVLKGEYYD